MSFAVFYQHLFSKSALSITYQCSCNAFHPLSSLFLCYDCSLLFCPDCSTPTIDTYFCPSCLNSVFSAHAHTNGSACERCVECPICSSTLTTIRRSQTLQCIWKCESCEWESDRCEPPLIGNDPSQLLSTFRTAERNQSLPLQNEFTRITNEMKRKYRLKNEVAAYEQSILRYGSGSATVPNALASSSAATTEPITDSNSNSNTAASTKSSTTSLSTLLPRRRPLMTKIAHRCNKCYKYVVKPGPGASKVAFEILHTALNSIPRVTIADFAALVVGKSSPLVIYFQNPLEKDIRFRCISVCIPAKDTQKDTEASSTEEKEIPPPSSQTSDVPVTAIAELVNEWINIPAYDEIAEDNVLWQDESDRSEKPADNPKLVAFRRRSKVGLHVSVTPLGPAESIQFALQVEFESVVSGLPGIDRLKYLVHFNLGVPSST